MNTQKVNRMMVGGITLACVLTVMVLGISGAAADEAECIAAIKKYDTNLGRLMNSNRQSIRVLKLSIKHLAKSAKTYDGRDDMIDKFLQDGKITQAEAQKMVKMGKKSDRIQKVIKRITETLELTDEHAKETKRDKGIMDKKCYSIEE